MHFTSKEDILKHLITFFFIIRYVHARNAMTKSTEDFFLT